MVATVSQIILFTVRIQIRMNFRKMTCCYNPMVRNSTRFFEDLFRNEACIVYPGEWGKATRGGAID